MSEKQRICLHSVLEAYNAYKESDFYGGLDAAVRLHKTGESDSNKLEEYLRRFEDCITKDT